MFNIQEELKKLTANAQPRAQKNIPQEMVAPKNRVTVDPESKMEYISEEDYEGNGDE